MGTERIPTVPIMGSITLSSLRIAGPIVALAAGAALSYFGAHKLFGEPDRIAVERVAGDVQSGKAVDPVLQELTRSELRRAQDGGLSGLAGLIAVNRAQEAGFDTPDGRMWLNRAVSDLRRGVAKSPGDGMAWLRLAGAEYLLDGPSQRAGAAMRMAATLVKSNASNVRLQLQLGAGLWTQLTPEQQDMMRGQIKMYWSALPKRQTLQALVVFDAGLVTLRESLPQEPGLEDWISEQKRALQRQEESQALRP
jgi:hypothetical protein